MIKAIVYNSHTGFTKQYAFSFAVSTGLPIYTIKEAKKKLNKNDEIIYFSWVNASKISNLNKVKNYDIKYIAAVGLSLYSEKLIDDLKKSANTNNIYYLQGGIRWVELNPFERLLMKSILKSLKKKEKNGNITEEELILLERMNYGYDKIDLNSLVHLIEWYNNQNILVQ